MELSSCSRSSSPERFHLFNLDYNLTVRRPVRSFGLLKCFTSPPCPLCHFVFSTPLIYTLYKPSPPFHPYLSMTIPHTHTHYWWRILSTYLPANEQALKTWTKQPLCSFLTVWTSASTAAFIGCWSRKLTGDDEQTWRKGEEEEVGGRREGRREVRWGSKTGVVLFMLFLKFFPPFLLKMIKLLLRLSFLYITTQFFLLVLFQTTATSDSCRKCKMSLCRAIKWKWIDCKVSHINTLRNKTSPTRKRQ